MTKLKALRLEGNRVGDAGAEALAAAIRGGGGAIELCPLLGTSRVLTFFFAGTHTHERSLPQTVTGLITETVRLWSLIE